MKSSSLLTSLVLPYTAAAHFGLTYPPWRADSLTATNDSISQWTFPCANIQAMQNSSQERTPWPLTGGSLALDLHHPWSYLFVNLGFGAEVSNFNVSLNPEGGKLVNETGNGTFCWNELQLPSVEILGLEVSEGMEASIQVVTVGDSGSALYNCADIVFTSNATLLPTDQCVNGTGITAESVQGSGSMASESDDSHDHNDTSSDSSASSDTSAASSLSTPFVLVLLAAGLLAL